MRKESENQASNSVMEGMTSIRAILKAGGNSASKITKILYDQDKIKKIGKEVSWLTHRGEELGFAVEASSDAEMQSYTTGHSHGGIIAFTEPREIPLLADAIGQIKEKGSKIPITLDMLYALYMLLE